MPFLHVVYTTEGPRCRPISQYTPPLRTVAASCCPNHCSITGFHGTSDAREYDTLPVMFGQALFRQKVGALA